MFKQKKKKPCQVFSLCDKNKFFFLFVNEFILLKNQQAGKAGSIILIKKKKYLKF